MAGDPGSTFAARWTPALLERIACPNCRSPLHASGDTLRCGSCGEAFPVLGGVLDLRPSGRRSVHTDHDTWSDHWSPEKQATLVQRFFSWYRKAVFARTVEYFVGRYFPAAGVFVEAGSGTSETSIRVDKRGGARTLVALDLIVEVLEQCDPIMDVRVAGDIFRLPFADDSIDGVWNVGVMEHFTHEQIDAILREVHRVLRPRAPVILLWPGSYSIPQKMLDVLAWFVNLRPRERPFRFHPAEISRLPSTRHGRDVLQRNGFDVVTIDGGVSSLTAFTTVVGAKRAPVQVEHTAVTDSGYSTAPLAVPTRA